MKRAVEKNIYIQRALEAADGKRTVALLSPRKQFDSAIIGTVDYDGTTHVLYSENAIIKTFMRMNKWSLETAIEWYEYNTVRALEYISKDDIRPLILFSERI